MNELLQLERKFWVSDADFYRKYLSAEAFMVFPGIGLLDRAAMISGIESGPRWTSAEITDERVVEVAQDVAVLAYNVLARREGDAPYRAAVSSVYVCEGDDWKLSFHHQSPMATGGDA